MWACWWIIKIFFLKTRFSRVCSIMFHMQCALMKYLLSDEIAYPLKYILI